LDADAGIAGELDGAAPVVHRAADDVGPAQAQERPLLVDQREGVGDAVAGQDQVFEEAKVGPGGFGLEVQGRPGGNDGGRLNRVAAEDGAAQGQVVLDGDPALFDERLPRVAVGVGQD